MSERFGRTPYDSADQIGAVVESGMFRRHCNYLPYAYCLFMPQKNFEALDTGAHGDPFHGPPPGDFDPGDNGV